MPGVYCSMFLFSLVLIIPYRIRVCGIPVSICSGILCRFLCVWWPKWWPNKIAEFLVPAAFMKRQVFSVRFTAHQTGVSCSARFDYTFRAASGQWFSGPNTRCIPATVISHVEPDRRASSGLNRAGAFSYPVHACRIVILALCHLFAASVAVITLCRISLPSMSERLP